MTRDRKALAVEGEVHKGTTLPGLVQLGKPYFRLFFRSVLGSRSYNKLLKGLFIEYIFSNVLLRPGKPSSLRPVPLHEC